MATPNSAPRLVRLLMAVGFGITGLATMLPSTVVASTSAITGLYELNIPAGNSAWVCGLVGADIYQAAAVTVTADVDGKALVSFAEPGWTPGDFPLHYAEPHSGTARGLSLDILSNTADTLKLDSTPAAAGLSSGIIFIVRKHATLSGLLPDGGGLAPFADTISLFGSNGLQTTYFFNSVSGSWITVLGFDASNAILRPGQGFVMQLASPKTVVFGKGEICYLKTTPTRVRVHANVPNILGALNPLGGTSATLGSLGVTTSLQAFNDSVVTLAPGSLSQTGTFLSAGSNLINSGTGQVSDNNTVPAGAGVVINVNAAKNVNTAPVSVTP